MRVLHIISEFSAHEAMGRTIVETVRSLPGEHSLIAAKVHDGHSLFSSVHEVGGGFATFTFRRRRALRAITNSTNPDVVHVHGGALAPFWTIGSPFGSRPVVYSVYGWPTIPGRRARRHATWAEMRRSNVLRPRVLLSSVLPASLARLRLRRSPNTAVLSPDPDVRERLAGPGVEVVPLPSGASLSTLRASYRADNPVVLFAGRAERVRGIDTLINAFPAVLRQHPDAKLRLLLIPTSDLDAVRSLVEAANLGGSCEVVTEPVADLEAELAAAQVGVWPFKFDYTTSPPAMALAEAMAVGLPVVSTPVTCVRSIAENGRNAAMVPVGDEAALADCINLLLDDADIWGVLAEGGRRTIAEHASWEQAALSTTRAYDAALTGRLAA